MAGLGWLFAWAKENGIELPLEENGSADIRKLLQLYDEWRAKNSGKTYRQNTRYEAILSEDKETRKPEKATGFNRLNTAHHQRHAKEMGFKNAREYERAAVEFFNSGDGEMFYSSSRKRFYLYNEKTQWLAVSSNGVVHTFLKRTKKEFARIRRQDKLE